MKTFSKNFLLALTVISFAFLFQSNKERIKSEGFNGNSLNLHCPSPPSFIQIANSEMKNNHSQENEEIDQSWYQNVIDNIEKEEYEIKYSEDLGAYQSPNRANNIRFIYHKDGFTAKTRDDKIPLFNVTDKTIREEEKKYETIEEWEITFKVDGITTNSTNSTGSIDFFGSAIKASGNKATIEDDNMRIDYTNDKEGMRQDFIVKKRPEGEGKLRMNLSAETKLKIIIDADAMMFKDDKGEDKMKYSSLKCWDANGLELRAYFEKIELQITNGKLQIEDQEKQIPNQNSQIPISKNSKFQIVVNDEGAVYPITIDPISTAPDWSSTYSLASPSAVPSVSTAGDVNGDGYSDVIVSISSALGGVVHCFYGSAAGPSYTVSKSLYGGKFFGFSVSTAGDVNGDGYSDIIVGNPIDRGFACADIDSGKAYVFYGSIVGLQDSNKWVAHGLNCRFGETVSTAGDVNGDGYSDVLIGHPNISKVYLWYGSSAGLGPVGTISNADWVTSGSYTLSGYGRSISTAGDVNGDGYGDVIIGEPNFDNEQYNEGKVYVFHGSSNGLSTSSNWSGGSDQSWSFFGASVSTAGDVNGDGYSDVITGANNYFIGQDTGAAFIWLGSSLGLGPNGTPSNADWVEEIQNSYDDYNVSVSTAGDVNGDGYSDVITGGYFADGSVYLGSISGPSDFPDWEVSFQEGINTAGDVNGDGYSDIITIDLEETSFDFESHVYFGFPAGLSSTSNWTKENSQIDSEFGYYVSTAGDVNGDGYSDVIIGAPLFDNGQTDEGKVFSYYGSSSGLSNSADWTEEINQAGANLGNSVSTAGDVNGDGYGDVIIGAYKYDNVHTDEGKAFVYHGSSIGLPSFSNWSTYGTQLNAKFGYAVSTAGDVNGDGYSDVVVGSPFYDNGQTDEGRAYVFYGSATGLFLSNWNTESNQAGANLGHSVSSAGDINGDGFSDLIIGEPNFDDLGFTNKGIVLVFHGSHLGLPGTPNWAESRNQSNTGFGWSVSGAGDVNGDGYSDVIIGAPYFDNSTANSGKAFVFHGSESGLGSTTGWNVEGGLVNGQLGYSVSSAGDVNGDGYSDVIVGTPFYENGQTFEGRASLYQGSPSGLSINVDWAEQGNRTYANFGFSVSSAGDVNGDGYSDVILGAPGGLINGQANVYYGNSGTGLRSTVNQFKPLFSNIVYSGGLTGTDGFVRLNIFGRSPFGRADGKIVYEHKRDGVPFSGDVITNSVSSSGSGTFTDLGVSGANLNKDIVGLPIDHEYKWRARVQYNLANNPYQKFGPWKYYTNYIPNPFGCFKAQNAPISVTTKTLNLTMFIQGFYDANSNNMVRDTARVYLRYSIAPYAIADSSKAYLTSSGTGTFSLLNSQNNVDYYIVIKHRNSIETWSAAAENFSSDVLTYNFSNAVTKAFGDNMIQADVTPVRFAIYNGDVNKDETVDATDVSTIDNDAANFVSGYVVTDLTGDDFVDGTDFAIADNNAANFVSAITP